MKEQKEQTAFEPSVGADERQSIPVCNVISLTDLEADFKSPEQFFEEWQREIAQASDPSYLKTISMTELLESTFAVKPPLIDGLLNAGTYLFVGAPKIGKSFLMEQLAYHVSTGTPFWGYPVRQGTVLYLALEDDLRRLQERMYRMFGTSCTDDLHFSVSAGKLGSGLDEQLSRFMREHPDTKLIIIDTLQKVRDADGDRYSYASDYQIIARLKQFADTYSICILLVHHTRKQAADDKFDMISGTNGLLGAADGAFLLSKEKRTSSAAILDVSGRDQQDQRLHLTRNESTLAWELERAETKLWKEPPEPLLEEVAKLITPDTPLWMGSPTELAAALRTDLKANALTMKLNVNAGRLASEYGIRYENNRSHNGRKVRLTYL